MIDELRPISEHTPVPPYEFNWMECFLVVCCCYLVVQITMAGFSSILKAIAGV